MEKITFDEFYERYKVRRNAEDPTSLYNNTMINFDESGLDLVERENPKSVWSLCEGKESDFILKTGIVYGHHVIGYFICSINWDDMKQNYELV